MNLNAERLSRHFSSLPDDELLRVVTAERADYRPEAVGLASKELMRRGVPLPLTRDELAPPAAAAFVTPAEREARRRKIKNGLLVFVYFCLSILVVFAHPWNLPLPPLPGVHGWLVSVWLTLVLVMLGGHIDRKYEAHKAAFAAGPKASLNR